MPVSALASRCARCDLRRRPRQCLASTFPELASGSASSGDDQRHEPVGRRSATAARTSAGVDLADHVADKHAGCRRRCSARTAAAAAARPATARSLASISPSSRRRPGELDLVVSAADELQAVDRLADDVTGAVCALPAQCRQRRVALGVERGVEVAAEPDAADHELARLAERARGRRDSSTTATSQPSSGQPIVTGSPGADGRRRLTTVASVGP